MHNSKQDINSQAGATNVVRGDDFRNIVIRTCRDIYDRLVEHCGPMATNALLIEENGGRAIDQYTNVFTKDGISIVEAIEFISPIQTHIKRMIAYVGRRVDNMSHDGTTTAMMMFAGMLADYLESDDADCKAMIFAFRNISAIIADNTITVDELSEGYKISLADAKQFVAWHQAMVSSKGDTELANAITEIIDVLPVELYGQFSVSVAPYESDNRYVVHEDDYDFKFYASPNPDIYNYNLKTEYLNESCDIFITDNDLVQGNPELEFLRNIVAGLSPTKDAAGAIVPPVNKLACDLVIIGTKIDPRLQDMANVYNLTSDNKIVIFETSVMAASGSRDVMLMAVRASAGVYTYYDYLINPMCDFIIHNAKIHLKNKNIHLSNIFKRDGSVYHPFYNDPTKFIPYTKLINTLKETIENYNSGRVRIETKQQQLLLQEYIDVYRRLICAKVRRLEIAGSRHDVTADYHVVQDSFGAVLSSLEHGFILDGLSSIYVNNNNPIVNTNILHILSIVHKSIMDVEQLESLLTLRKFGKYSFIQHGKTEVTQLCNITSTTDENGNVLLDASTLFGKEIDDYILMQPAKGLSELFRRVEELLPKLVNTSCAIIPNTVNSEGDE